MQNNLLLPALIFIPIIAGFLCWLVEKVDERLPRWIAFLGMLLTFLITVAIWQNGNFIGSAQTIAEVTAKPVSYTHLTLPTIYSV